MIILFLWWRGNRYFLLGALGRTSFCHYLWPPGLLGLGERKRGDLQRLSPSVSLVVMEIQDHLSWCSSFYSWWRMAYRGSTQSFAFIRVDIPQLSSICMSNDEAWQIKINDTFPRHTHPFVFSRFLTLLKALFISVRKICYKLHWNKSWSLTKAQKQ